VASSYPPLRNGRIARPALDPLPMMAAQRSVRGTLRWRAGRMACLDATASMSLGGNAVAIQPIANAPKSRRALLAGLTGSLLAAVAGSLGRTEPVSAHDADDVRLGGTNSASNVTSIHVPSANDSDGLRVITSGDGVALGGHADTNYGIIGNSNSGIGILGASGGDIGVKAISYDNYGVFGITTIGSAAIHGEHSHGGAGVEGTSDSGPGLFGFSASGRGVKGAGRIGIQGDVGPTQTAVHGFVGPTAAPLPPTGVAIVAQAADSSFVALHVKGRAKFDRSGVLTVGSNTASVTKSLAGVTSSSLVLAVLAEDLAGIWVRAAVPAAGSFTIHLNKPVANAATVTWFVLG